MTQPRRIVVLGSGIIGLCSAYEVLRLSSDAHVTLVEASPSHLIAGGASSYAGGFIACGAECKSRGRAGRHFPLELSSPCLAREPRQTLTCRPLSPGHDEPSRDLARLSWQCHTELASKFDGANAYGWRECGAVGLSVGGHSESRSKYRSLPGAADSAAQSQNRNWVEGDREELSTEGGVAQM